MPPTDEAKEAENALWAAVAFRGAVDKGELDEVETMLSEGANPIYKMGDGASWTVLMLAANGGHAPLVDRLCKGGRMPKVEDKDPAGFQAVMLAAFKGHAAICQALLDKKADVNCKNEDGETPLMMAAAEGHLEVVQLLLSSGADPDALDKNDMSAIKKAARWGRTGCLKELLPKVRADPRQLKHCLLFGRLYEHPDVAEEIRRILEPEGAAVGEEDALDDDEAARSRPPAAVAQVEEEEEEEEAEGAEGAGGAEEA
mmetsp:Transcript_78201/g.221748  ORF Transcript_78201/g.221748 Transcript_78201/m.221748 type:complete len:257 (+) Transcript_78201:92-862(+)